MEEQRQGTVTFAPSAALTDASGQEILSRQPIVVPLDQDETPVVSLLATDNPGVRPARWTWSVKFTGTALPLAPFSFALPYSDGETQPLSGLVRLRSSRGTQTRRAVLAATAAGIGGLAGRTAPHSSPAQVPPGSELAAAGRVRLTGTVDRCARADPLPVPRTFITRFQRGSKFALTDAAASSDPHDARLGNSRCASRAATVVTVGDGLSYASLTSTALKFDTAGKDLAVRYRLSSTLATRALELEISNDRSFKDGYRWQFADRSDHVGAGYSYDGEWVQIFLSFADAAVIGRPRRRGLTAARLRIQDNGRPVTVHWQEISLVDEPRQLFPHGVATICLDDIYQTQYTYARPVLDAHGFPATVAVIREAIGLDHSMSLEQLRSLQDDLGWEIGCHSDSLAVHRATDLGVPLSVLDSDLRRELAYLGKNGFRNDKFLAYPSGLWDPGVLRVASQHRLPGRLDMSRTQGAFPPSDPYKLRACGIISSAPGGRSASEVKGYIDAAAENLSWLILIFHKIVRGSPVQRTECALSDFEEIIAHLAGSGLRVRTIGQVMRLARSV